MPVLIGHLWQFKTVAFLHWCLIHTGQLGGLPMPFILVADIFNQRESDYTHRETMSEIKYLHDFTT